MKTKKLAEMSMLAAIALIIFIVESRIPALAPVPGMKLGLANIITVFSLYRFKPSEAAMILLVRVILGSVFAGNISSLMYSVSGAAACLAGMIFMKRIIPEKYLYLSSACGALFHNAGQTAAACVIMKTTAVISYFPFLVVSGTIAGLFTGFCAMFVLKRLERHTPSADTEK